MKTTRSYNQKKKKWHNTNDCGARQKSARPQSIICADTCKTQLVSHNCRAVKEESITSAADATHNKLYNKDSVFFLRVRLCVLDITKNYYRLLFKNKKTLAHVQFVHTHTVLV